VRPNCPYCQNDSLKYRQAVEEEWDFEIESGSVVLDTIRDSTPMDLEPSIYCIRCEREVSINKIL